ncbi:PBP1A family penicillin-binding protein [Aurantiacibacter aquimixticola]|uniref:PBP1A family penicillin-binding protein n=2 Tax=Aurantiacibacter aquimixticola TaxID=1958945 RepID=A0A419RVH9_9SPHN|nr:PBP1A family penicillin-binding protein [Aurantiacibacter aquimixticola]RJY09792.1 PBP1A family penicillin-binding protein [Aurantiacibacter aquimixticola]
MREQDAGQRGWKAGLWRWTKRLVVFGIVAVLLGALGLFTSVYFAAQSMPSFASLKQSQVGQTILVRARDGSEIVELGPSYGQWLDADEIPQVMKDAMVSVEDHRFYSHLGVDPMGLARAVYNATMEDRRVSATSTISQQLARNIFLNSNRTIDRKMREAVLAMALEYNFTKDEILELYLNKVYFGGGAYGIDSASRRFFSHSARDLSLEEAAIIAGLVKAPSRYAPTADVEAAVGRANVVIAQMVKYGDLDPAVARQVDVEAVNLRETEGQNSIRYFTDWVLPQLDLLLPSGTFEPIEVWTTLDVGMQRAATAAVQSNAPSGAQGALVSMDRDGAILALVGGTDYVTSNYNRATDAMRQPGSAFKLFVYLSALEAGYNPDTMVKDVPVEINGWSPRNSGGSYAGDIDLRTAFAYSKNSVAAQLGNEVGFSNVASMARRFGVTTSISTVPSMTLGSNEVRLLDMTRAYAAVSAGGESVEPYGIMRVTTVDGEELYRHKQARAYRLVPDYVAAGITDLLQTAVATGTGRAAQIGRPVAGKTGTTNSNRDGYFVGFSSGITTGVWMGRDDNARVSALQGGSAPAQAFAAFMRYAVRDRPVEEFDTDLKLPEWQLEPDDEFYLGDEDDYYYYIDEQGNLVEPGGTRRPPEEDFDIEGERPGTQRDPAQRDRPAMRPEPQPRVTRQPQLEPPQAASDDFLERATGRELPQDEPRQRRVDDRYREQRD